MIRANLQVNLVDHLCVPEFGKQKHEIFYLLYIHTLYLINFLILHALDTFNYKIRYVAIENKRNLILQSKTGNYSSLTFILISCKQNMEGGHL